METVSAILVARHRLTESSLIAHWCSAECGLFKTVAKGALRPKSAFAGRLDLFVTCEVTFARRRQSDLHTLKEVHLSDARLTLRSSYLRILVASYFAELVTMVVEKETPLPEIHELLQLALDHLTNHQPSAKLVTRFENRLCAVLGLGELTQGGAATLHDVFHRQLPHERRLIFDELNRLEE